MTCAMRLPDARPDKPVACCPVRPIDLSSASLAIGGEQEYPLT